jgi:glycosyltransferase involved in cell wall biosynthesis
MNLKDYKLALHYHIPITIKDDGYYYPEYYGSWVDSLAPYFKEIICITYSKNKEDTENRYKLKNKNIAIIDLGEKLSLKNRIMKYKQYQNILKQNLHKFDIIIYRVPTPLAIYFYPLTKNKINVFFLVGNMVKGLESSKNNINPIKYYLWKFYWKWDHRKLQKYANNSLTLSNGPTFLNEFPNIKNQKIIFTSTIYDKDVLKVKKFQKLHNSIKLLYIGRISNEKSIDTLIKAINILNKKGIKVELNIAGSGDKDLENKLKKLVNTLNIKNIKFLGHISKKEDIKELFDSGDIFIIPSSWDCQPRTMWEAMARGLPIICSDGVKSPGILFSHKKDMLFFKARDENDLANNIKLLIEDNNLREYLIKRSLEIAKSRTIEKSVELQVENILEYIK